MTRFKLLLIISLLLFNYTKAQVKDVFHTEYDSTETAFDNFTSGFSNVFHEHNSTFRIRVKDTGNGNENPIIFEKLINNKWSFIDSLNYTYCFTHSVFFNINHEDYDFDGAKDFIVEYHWKWNKNNETIKLAYTFDKVKKTFKRIGYFSGKPKKVKGYSDLYYDEWNDRYNDWSYLFTLRNNERVNLGIAETKVKLNKSADEIISIPQYVSIRKMTNTTDIEILRLNNKQLFKFNYGTYWLKNAKQFYDDASNKIRTQKNEFPKYFEPIE